MFSPRSKPQAQDRAGSGPPVMSALRFRDVRFEDATSAAARRLDCSDVDLFHLHHRIEGALGGSGIRSVTALVRAIGVICQDNPHLSLHQPHALSSPPLPRNRRWGNRVRDLDQRVSLPLRRAQTGEQAQAARQRARLLVHYRNSSTKLMIRQPPDRRFEPSGARQTDRGVCPTWLVVNWTSLDRRARYETLNNWNFNSSGISVLLLASKALPERRRKSMLPSQVYRSKFKSSKRKSRGSPLTSARPHRAAD
jgi:hypothetical protein